MSEAQLAGAIRDRRLVLFAGSGLVRDAGLPDWAGLATSLCGRLLSSSDISPETAAAAQSLIRKADLGAAIQMILSEASRAAATAVIRDELNPTRDSSVVKALAKWNVRGVVTTNFDRVTEGLVGPAAYRLDNSEASMKLVTAAAGGRGPFVWRIHGDIDNELDPIDPKVSAGGPFMVLSKSDFTALVQGDRGRQLLAGVLSILQTYSVAFIGYGFGDPDIDLILRWLRDNCKFTNQSWFIGRRGDRTALPQHVERLDPISSWSELVGWIDSLTTTSRSKAGTAAVSAPARTLVTSKSAYLAVSRYLGDLETTGSAERVLAAAFIDEMAEYPRFSLSLLTERVEAMLGVGPVFARSLAEATIRLLVDFGLVAREGDNVVVRPSALAKLRTRAKADWGRERQDFFSSAIGRLPAGSATLSGPLRNALESTLLDLFSELGEAMAEWVSRGVGGEVGWPDLSDRLRHYVTDAEDLRRCASLLRLILNHPRDEEIPYLYRLISATFLANTVRLNPVAAAELRQSMSLYDLYLDANVVLPLVVDEHPYHQVAQRVVEESLRAGVQLSVLTPILNEVTSHRDVARRELDALGGDRKQLLMVSDALGTRTNVFLQGFLRYQPTATIGARADWRSYLSGYSDRAIAERLAALGVAVVKPDVNATRGSFYAEALAAIRAEWRGRLGGAREDLLNEHEAIQVSHIYLKRKQSPEDRAHIWFLSNETVLQQVFDKNPSKWLLPATFPYSAWVAFLDSRLPQTAQDPGAIVKAILRGRPEAFELPSPIALIRQHAFGDRVTSREEEEALEFALSDFALMKRVEAAQKAVYQRGAPPGTSRTLVTAHREVVAEISSALDAEIARLNRELSQARSRIGQLESKPTVPTGPGSTGTKESRVRKGRSGQ